MVKFYNVRLQGHFEDFLYNMKSRTRGEDYWTMNKKVLGQVATPWMLFPNWTIRVLKNDKFLLLIGQT